MKFKDLFDKEILTETSQVRKDLKIYYELNLSLIKPQQEQPQNNQQNTDQTVQNNQADQNNQIDQSAEQNPQPQEQPIQQEPQEQPQETSQDFNQVNQNKINSMFSVVTEDDNDKLATTTEEKIERQFSGEIKLSQNQKDNIQSLVDIVEVLADTKKDGTPILDDFSTEIINLCIAQNFQQLQSSLDKKSKIFVEIFYGYTKFDSIGVRFNKHPNSEILVSTMLLDNNIINAKFSIDKINEKVAEFRNYEADKLNK